MSLRKKMDLFRVYFIIKASAPHNGCKAPKKRRTRPRKTTKKRLVF